MITWPCLLKLDGDDELVYLKNTQNFNAECSDLILSDGDYVIDSKGKCYLLTLILNKPTLIKTKRIYSSEEVTALIQAHEFKKSALCLTKIHFLTVAAAIQVLEPNEVN